MTAEVTAGVTDNFGLEGTCRTRADSSASTAAARAGKGTGRCSGGPRRLRMCTSMAPAFSSSHSLSRAGDPASRAPASRKTNGNRDCSCAASCRRLSSASLACGNQARTAVTSAQRSACSVAHKRAPGLPARRHSSRSAGRPCAARQGMKGACGGATRTTGPGPSTAACASAGSTSCQKDESTCGCSSSTMPSSGQPPPGSWASSAAWPLAMTRPGWRASSSPRQTASGPVTSNKETRLTADTFHP